MATLPDRARVVVIGAGIVGNSMAWHLARLGWRDIVLLEKGTLPSPGRIDGSRLQLHLPDRPLEGDDRVHAGLRAPVRGARRVHETGGIEVARTPERMQELTRRITSSKSWGIEPVGARLAGAGQGARAVHQRGHRPRRRLLAEGRRRRLARGRHAHAQEGPGAGRADDRRRASRSPASTSRTAGSSASGRTSGDIEAETVVIACGVLEPADRGDGRRVDPAHARGPPDDRHRAGGDLRARRERGRLPDHPRRRHEHVRAPARQRVRGRLVRPPARSSWTPTTSRRSPRRRCRRRCCRSPRRTSTRSSRTRSSCSRTSWATRRPA